MVTVTGALVATPATTVASDYTPLWFLFLEVPVFALALLFFALVFIAPRTGAVVSGLLFAAAFFVVVWFSSMEFSLLLLSFLVNLAAIAVAVKKINAPSDASAPDQPPPSAGHEAD